MSTASCSSIQLSELEQYSVNEIDQGLKTQNNEYVYSMVTWMSVSSDLRPWPSSSFAAEAPLPDETYFSCQVG